MRIRSAKGSEVVSCIKLPNGGIACSRGKRISKEALAKDLEMIAQFERELQEGKYGKHRREG
jgi:hypothetical protein